MKEIKIIDYEGKVEYLWGDPVRLWVNAQCGCVVIYLKVSGANTDIKAYYDEDNDVFYKYERDIEQLFLRYVLDELKKEQENVTLDFSDVVSWREKVEDVIKVNKTIRSSI